MKARDPGYWYQGRSNVTNVNIYSNLTTGDLVNLTTVGLCLHQQAVEDRLYLSWPDMKWNVFGGVETLNVTTKEFCTSSASEDASLTLLSGDP